MRINGNFNAHVYHYGGRARTDDNRRFVDIEVSRGREELGDMLDNGLAEAVFAGYVTEIAHHDDGDEAVGMWKLKNPKPSKRVVPEMHRIKTGDHAYDGQPSILRFVPIEDSDRVLVQIRLPIGEAQGLLRRELEDSLGGHVDISFAPSQMELPES